MANNGKATNSDPQYCTQKINNFGTQIQRKAGVSSCSPDGLVIHGALVAPVVYPELKIR